MYFIWKKLNNRTPLFEFENAFHKYSDIFTASFTDISYMLELLLKIYVYSKQMYIESYFLYLILKEHFTKYIPIF